MDSFPPQLVNSLLWQTPQLQQHIQPQPPQPPQQQQQSLAIHGYGGQQHSNHQMPQYPLQFQQLAQLGQRQTQPTPTSDTHTPQLFSNVDIGGGVNLPMKVDHSGALSFASLSVPMSAGPYGSSAAPPFLNTNMTASPSTSDMQTAAVSPGLRVTIPKDLNGSSLAHQDRVSSGLNSSTSPMDADETSSQSGAATGEGTHSPEPNGDSSSKKRHRLRPDQTRRLLEVFEKTTKPDSEMRKALGKQLDLAPRTVQIWFQNRRAKLKRESNASDPLKMTGYYGTGMYASRGRLSFNRAYLGRRQMGGRNDSEGFDHFRSVHGFEPYPQQEPFRGLPLQNPSQMVVSNSASDMSPHFTLQSISGGQPIFNQSAMGVPAGQGPTGAGTAHVLSGAMSASAMSHHASAMAAATGFNGQTSPHTAAPQTQACVQPVALQLQPSSQDAATRGYQAQPHTPVDGGMVSDDYIASMAFNSQRSPQQQQQQHSRHQAHGFSTSVIPSAEVLLQSRRRHLQDLMIINQTHAARGINPAALPASASEIGDSDACKPLLFSELTQAPSLSSAATAPASLDMAPLPLITASSFVDAATVPRSLASADANSVAIPAPPSQLATLNLQGASDNAPASTAMRGGALDANVSNDDSDTITAGSLGSYAGGGGGSTADIRDKDQDCDGSTSLISGSPLSGLRSGMASSVAHTPLLSAAATSSSVSSLLPPSCRGSDTATAGHYQLLNDLLLQCNAFDFLNNAGFGGVSDMQSRANGTSLPAEFAQFDQQQQVQPSSVGDSPCVNRMSGISPSFGIDPAAQGEFGNCLGNISIASADSLFSDTSALASAVAAAYMHSGDQSSSSTCSTSGPSTDLSATSPCAMAKSGSTDASSSAGDPFMAASASSSGVMDMPLAAVLSQKQGINHPSLHGAPQAGLGPNGIPKMGSNNSVIVETSGQLVAQRDTVIEQIYPEGLLHF